VARDEVDAVTRALRDAGEPPLTIGEIIPCDGDERVRYRGALEL
jgi:hypothetical protein